MSVVSRIGVRGRLLLAFLGISGFAVAAAGAAMYAFERAGDVLLQITEERLPPVVASLELSREAERIVAAAPALLSVSTPGGAGDDLRSSCYRVGTDGRAARADRRGVG